MFTSASIQAAEIKYFPAPNDKAQNVGVMPEIYINGDIDDKTFLGIKNIVDKNKLNQARIIINSDGGNLYENSAFINFIQLIKIIEKIMI